MNTMTLYVQWRKTVKFFRDVDDRYTWYIKVYISIIQSIIRQVRWWSLHYNEHVLKDVIKVKKAVLMIQILMNLQTEFERLQTESKKLHRRVELNSKLVNVNSKRVKHNMDLRTSQLILRDSECDEDFDILYNVCLVSSLAYLLFPLIQITFIAFLPVWTTIMILIIPPTTVALIIIAGSLSVIQCMMGDALSSK